MMEMLRVRFGGCFEKCGGICVDYGVGGRGWDPFGKVGGGGRRPQLET